MPTLEMGYGHGLSWWQRKKSIYKFRLIVSMVIMFGFLPWIVGFVVLLSLTFNVIF